GEAWRIQAAIGTHTSQDPGRTAATSSATAIAGCHNTGLNCVISRVGRVARSHGTFEEGTNRTIAVVAANAQENGTLLVHGVVPGRTRSIPHRSQATRLRIARFNRPLIGFALHHRGDVVISDGQV